MSSTLYKLISASTMILLVLLIEIVCVKIGWEMFMVPVFKLPELNWEQAIGFCILASCFNRSSPIKKD